MSGAIKCDADKQISVFVTIDGKGKTSPAGRVERHRQEFIDFLRSLPPVSEKVTGAGYVASGACRDLSKGGWGDGESRAGRREKL